VTFTGLVRELDDADLKAMELEHYPGMTEKALQKIIDQARERWPLKRVWIKRDAPFWKREVSDKGSVWVEQKGTDLDAANSWD